mgnify:CR=1 FL=1
MKHKIHRQLVPHALTTLGISATITAMHLLWVGEYLVAMFFVLVAMLFDVLDGPIARRLGVVSRFGAYFDSVADTLLYLFTPVMLFFMLGYSSMLMWLACTTFVVFGIVRLVRYTQEGILDVHGKWYFVGMPVVWSVPLMLCTAFAYLWNIYILELLLSAILVTGAFLKVSTIRFERPRSPRTLIALLVLVKVLIALAYLYGNFTSI